MTPEMRAKRDELAEEHHQRCAKLNGERSAVQNYNSFLYAWDACHALMSEELERLKAEKNAIKEALMKLAEGYQALNESAKQLNQALRDQLFFEETDEIRMASSEALAHFEKLKEG